MNELDVKARYTKLRTFGLRRWIGRMIPFLGYIYLLNCERLDFLVYMI